MSNFKEVHGKLRLYVSFLEFGRHVKQLRRRRRAYAPTSNTASQDNHEKINSWVSFIFPLHDEYGAPLGGPWGRRSSAKNLLKKANGELHTAEVVYGRTLTLYVRMKCRPCERRLDNFREFRTF